MCVSRRVVGPAWVQILPPTVVALLRRLMVPGGAQRVRPRRAWQVQVTAPLSGHISGIRTVGFWGAGVRHRPMGREAQTGQRRQQWVEMGMRGCKGS